MRRLATAEGIRALLSALGREARQPTQAYVAGGATAVLLGWRDATIDVDLKLAGNDVDRLLRAIPHLKETLQINVELATPDHFIPVRDGWEDRSRFESQDGNLAVYHFELVWQALAKIHRGHRQDLEDVDAMLRLGFVDASAIRDAFDSVEADLYRFPNIDPASFRRAVDIVLGDEPPGQAPAPPP
jgi:hypothetical protein